MRRLRGRGPATPAPLHLRLARLPRRYPLSVSAHTLLEDAVVLPPRPVRRGPDPLTLRRGYVRNHISLEYVGGERADRQLPG